VSPLQQRTERETRRLLQQAMRAFGRTVPAVEIRFDLTGRSAGMIRLPARESPVIRYNRLLMEENRDAFIAQTVPHEVAHLVARCVFGRAIRPHGREWRKVMDFFGVEARRCHEFDVSRAATRRLKRFTYSCGCRRHQLSSIRHNRVLAGQRYHCTGCGELLKRDRRECG
jgi:SprT protein